MKEESDIVRLREVDVTPEFDAYYLALDRNTQEKFKQGIAIIETVKVLSTKHVKKLLHTPLYEMRISIGNNEYRTILFTVDDRNVILSTKVVLLNGFLKKSTKDYEKQIKKALKLIDKYNLWEI
ncbi:MAG: type II toxin-antitoxin system RelE/ParE family toxin [Parabacteroides gordonii]|nr:type II toxin-antitoxin system RelE/ParE family toxin [Parabacteroides gordonii]